MTLGMIAAPVDPKAALLKIEHLHFRILVFLIGFFLIGIGRKIIQYSKLSKQLKSFNNIHLDNDGSLVAGGNELKDFILVLRAFDVDYENSSVYLDENVYAKSFQIDSVEEQLIRSLKVAGEVVAVRDPRDKFLSIGALKFYLKKGDWQRQVQKLIADAKLVVLYAGLSPGLIWEVQQCLNHKERKKIAIVIPANSNNSKEFLSKIDNFLNTNFVDVFQNEKKYKIPFILWFNYDNQPQFNRTIIPKNKQSLRYPLQPFFIFGFEKIFKQNNITWNPPRYGVWYELGYGCLGILIFYGVCIFLLILFDKL